MSKKKLATKQHSLFGIATALIGLLIMTACSSPPKPPTQEIMAAEQAINTAEKNRVADYASVELTEAREKLTAARLAVTREQMVTGQRLAEESRVDAELASAKSEAAKANAINTDMQRSNETLQQEMQRNTGIQP